MKKKFTVLLLALTLALGACLGLTACGDKDKGGTTPKAITEGVFDGTYTGGGYKQDVYIRFHKTGEVIEGKQTFYFHAVSGEGATAQVQAGPLFGVYEVLDEEITMKAWQSGAQRAEDQGGVFTDRKADKTIVLKSLDGTTEYCRTGWDTKEDKLLGIPVKNADLGVTADNAMGVPSFYGNYCYLRKIDERVDRGVQMAKFYADVNGTRNASITIYHNGTYVDDKVTGTQAITGTYTQAGDVYTLTAGTGAKSGTLTVMESGATFAVTGADSIAMTTVRQRTSVYTLSSADNGATLTLYDDNSAEYALGNNSAEGTWSEDNEGLIVTIGKRYYSEKEDNHDGTFCYVIDIEGVQVKSASISSVLYTYTGRQGGLPGGGYFDITMKLFADGTATYEGVGSSAAYGTQEGTGTWEGRTVTINITKPQAVTMTFTIAENTEGEGYTATTNGLTLIGDKAPAALPLYTYTGRQGGLPGGGYFDITMKLFADGTATYEGIGSSAAYGTQEGTGTWEGRTVTINITKPQAVTMTFTIAENTEGEGYTATTNGLTLTGDKAPEDAGEGTPDNPPAATVLYTLTGTVTGAGDKSYSAELKLKSDYTFELVFTDTDSQTATAASGTFAQATDNPMNFTLTVGAGGQYTENTEITVVGTYSGYTPTGMSAQLPKQTMDYNGNPITLFEAATLTWSAQA